MIYRQCNNDNACTKGVETRTYALDAAHIDTRDIEIDPMAHCWKPSVQWCRSSQ